MKKNKFIVFYVIFASIILAASIGYLGFNLFNEYNHGFERTKRRFEHLSNNISKISQKEYSSVNEYKIELEKVIGDTNDFAYLEIKENYKTIFIYPDATSKTSSDSKLISNFNKSFNVNNNYYSISGDLYTLRPISIYYYARISFLIILIIGIITTILIIYYNVHDKKVQISEDLFTEQENTEKFEESEQIDVSKQTQQETQTTDNSTNSTTSDNKEFVNDSKSEEQTTEITQEEIEQKSDLVLPVGDFQPVKIETLNSDEIDSPKGLFSPTTGLGWEEYLKIRLDNELNRAISSEFDLALMLFKIPNLKRDDSKIKECCDYLIDQFQFKDLIFEYKEDCIAAIKINFNLENALTFSDKLYLDLKSILGEENKCYIGISTRTLRMLSSDRLLLEADEALVHAQENPENPIIAFRANVEKYRQFMENN